MKTIRILIVLLLSVGVGSAFGSDGKAKPAHKPGKHDKLEDKAEKRDLKAFCRDHTKAECKQAKHDFKADEKAEKPPKK